MSDIPALYARVLEFPHDSTNWLELADALIDAGYEQASMIFRLLGENGKQLDDMDRFYDECPDRSSMDKVYIRIYRFAGIEAKVSIYPNWASIALGMYGRFWLSITRERASKIAAECDSVESKRL